MTELIIARVLGSLLLLAWLVFIPVGQRVMRIQGRVMHATIFQYNILPFLVGVSLLVYGRLLLLVMLPVCWVLAVPFPSFFLFAFPLVVGWQLGSTVFTDMYPHSAVWYWGGGAIGAVVAFVVCSVVVAIVTLPPSGKQTC